MISNTEIHSQPTQKPTSGPFTSACPCATQPFYTWKKNNQKTLPHSHKNGVNENR